MRIFWVDTAKGVGIFLVILGHLVTYGSPIFNWIFCFHMPLFFFLSGYVYKYDPSFSRCLKKTVTSLVLPYFLISFFAFALSIMVPAFRPESMVEVAFQTLFQTQPEALHVGQIWFLFCLAIVQALFIGLKACRLRNKQELGMVVLLLTATLGLNFLYSHTLKEVMLFGHHFPRPPFKTDSALMGLFFFYLGHMDRQHNFIERIRTSFHAWRLPLVFILLMLNLGTGPLLNGTTNLAINDYHNPLLFLVSATSGIYMVVLACTFLSRIKTLVFFGSNSMPIFVLHSIFLYLFAFLLSTLFAKPFHIMENIPLPFCFVGLFFVSLCSLPVPYVYQATIGRLTGYFSKRWFE